MSSRLKTLDNLAAAAGGAFAYDEGDFDRLVQKPARIGRVVAALLAFASFGIAIAHQMGWANLVAGLGIGRTAA